MHGDAGSGAAGRPTTWGGPPREVRWAGLALWVVAALYAMSGALNLLTRDKRISDLRADGSPLSDAELERSVTLGIAITAVFAVAVAAVAVISAVNAVRGRRWARVSGTVVAALAGALSVLRLAGGGANAVISAVLLVASVAAVGLLYRRAASTFFGSEGAARPGGARPG